MSRVLSLPVDALRDGRAVVEAHGHSILVLDVGGRVHALASACPHEGNPLIEGDIVGDVLECAYHGWRFDLATGSCLFGTRAARRYEAELCGEEIRIRLD